MVDRWLVFGGWAVVPEILQPIFGDNAVYIDTNEIVPHIVYDDAIVPDWQDKLYSEINSIIPEKPFGIAGWSTGSILAGSLSSRLHPAVAVFLSATPSFCRRRESGFLFGQKSAVLKAMREQLAVDQEKVVLDFCRQCGIGETLFWVPSMDIARKPLMVSLSNHEPPDSILRQAQDERDVEDNSPYKRGKNSPDRLIAGLHFLEQVTLLPVNKLPFPSLFLHGKTDTIIPPSAGRYFSDAAGGIFAEYDGPHAFFMKDPATVTNDINNFIKKVV